jgi:glycosyltransferase involved in cell wall biosynthesis
MSALEWHVITGEYPPQPGGVSDYTRTIARGLARAGDRVCVWAPPCAHAPVEDPGVVVRRLPDRFGPRALRALDWHFSRPASPRRLLIQYVPQAFGWKGMNVPFCAWARSRVADPISVMFHEVAFPIDRDRPVMQRGLGFVTHGMAALIAQSAERVFVAIPAWKDMLASVVADAHRATWLPVPSTIEPVADPACVRDIRLRYASDAPLIGHFGTFGGATRPLLVQALVDLLGSSAGEVVLIGRGSQEMAAEFVQAHSEFCGRLHATGTLGADEISHHVSACDLMFQPYIDGVSTRRTTSMVALSHGRPLVTTKGPLTENLWEAWGAAALADAGDPGALAAVAATVLHNRALARRLAAAGRALYDARFDVRHTIAALRNPGAQTRAESPVVSDFANPIPGSLT